MKQCLIYDNSLRFARAGYGILAVIAFLIDNYWLVLVISILMVFGIFSTKFNILYQLHRLVLRKLLKKKAEPIQKESGELSFVCSMGGTVFFISFLFLCFGKFISLAWSLVLIISLLMLFAGFTGICAADPIYAVFKQNFKK